MYKVISACVLLFTTSLAHGQIIETFKNTPATKYDIGKLELQMTLNTLSGRLRDEMVGNTPFQVDNFRLEERNGQLYIIARLRGPASHIEQSRCNNITNQIREREGLKMVARNTWPNLNEAQYQQLSSAIIITTELVEDGNSERIVRCS